jgi:two-component system copper resistance phosphate regulon response regulator CusR
MPLHLLIVEDDPRIADFLQRGLREEGFNVDWAATASDGWFRLQQGEWDAVILDWWLPGEDGVHLLARFRQRDRRTPVLMLTARDAVADRVQGLDAGADDYLCKPFSFEELLARLRALIRRRDDAASPQLQFGDVTVDLATQQAVRGREKLDLTAKEYQLLACFLRNPGKVLSRTRIYEQVWDEQFDGLSNTLEVHVKELRRKLERHGPRIIQTLRGRGYVLASGGGEDSP